MLFVCFVYVLLVFSFSKYFTCSSNVVFSKGACFPSSVSSYCKIVLKIFFFNYYYYEFIPFFFFLFWFWVNSPFFQRGKFYFLFFNGSCSDFGLIIKLWGLIYDNFNLVLCNDRSFPFNFFYLFVLSVRPVFCSNLTGGWLFIFMALYWPSGPMF